MTSAQVMDDEHVLGAPAGGQGLGKKEQVLLDFAVFLGWIAVFGIEFIFRSPFLNEPDEFH